MNGVAVVTWGAVPPQPWRNGGGVTRELLAWPAGAPWQCRISVADIDRDGDFSAFPGVERWFAVIAGAGVELVFASGALRLSPDSEPYRFDGEVAPGCRLIAGPTRDLNLMAQQSAGRAEMQRVLPGVTWHSTAALRAVFTAGALNLQLGGNDTCAMPAGALAWSDTDAGAPWQCELPADAAPAWWLAFHRHAA